MNNNSADDSHKPYDGMKSQGSKTSHEGLSEKLDEQSSIEDLPMWVDNDGNKVDKVFGFNESAELVNGRAAMFGFILLILTELAFKGSPVTKTIFGIG